jgi:2'-5' RNA ligase
MPVASVPIFLSLDPDPTIDALIMRYKAQVRSLVGDQLFLADPPHVTVYLAHFSDRAAVNDVAAELADKFSPPEIEITGWHVFERDQLTGNQTLVCQFSDPCIAQLQAIQASVIRRLALLRDSRASEARYASRMQALSPVQQHSVREFGFPFTGKQWHPHLTIASIRPNDWPIVADRLLGDAPQTTGSFSSLTVYELDGLEPISLGSFPLCSFEVST